ncbi:hypothetical protein AB3N59_20370 (plasmid) [Leptospira sp. WS92.C1]
MKKDLIKVYKKLPDGKEVELLADESQLDALSKHPSFRIPETKEKETQVSSKNKAQIPEGEQGI